MHTTPDSARKRFIWCSLALIVCCGACNTGKLPNPAPVKSDDLLVKVAEGKLVGTRHTSPSLPAGTAVYRWLGVPFAAPPVGQLRWREPQPAYQRDTVLLADHFRAAAMQHNVYGDMMYRADSFAEDCLYLNVWAPASGAENLPVLLYFYGGGLIAGDGSETRYDGAAMAAEGIVVVTANYRLNVFGWLAHPELTAESPHHTSGNYGHLDQVAALEWVHANISAFGGDPDHIVIAGESAGSISVSALLASPLSRNFIAGAIGESGASFPPLYSPVSLAEAEAIGAAFAKTIAAPTLAELRAMSADTLYARYLRYGKRLPIVLDKHFYEQPVHEAYRAGKAARVPLLVGWNSQEAAPGVILGGDTSQAAFRAGVRRIFPAVADQLLKLMPHTTTAEITASAVALASDAWIAYPTWSWAQAHALHTGAPVYRYRYEQPQPGQHGGAPHAAEIPYALGNLPIHKVHEWTDADYQTSATMRAAFANFIKTFDPNLGSHTEWQPIDPHAQFQSVMRFKVEAEVAQMDDRRYPILQQFYSRD